LAAFLRRGGGWYLAALALSVLGSAQLGSQYAAVRYHDEMTRQTLLESQGHLDNARSNVAVSRQMLRDAAQPPAPQHTPYLVISIAERRLWYKRGENVLMTTMVATGSGKTLVKERGTSVWRFDTPRGRLVVESKEENPLWVPPDWFYLEEARKLKLGVVHLKAGQALAAADGSRISVVKGEVIRGYPGGRRQVMQPSQQHLIIVDGRVLVPPLGTSQRRFEKVLGTHRLNLGDGYALHGTNLPETVGQAVSHGCVRLLNEDIAKLYQMVPVGTPVYLY
jgi:lipoprotein-anchoring transpeptidase ErfK/SrfK